VPRSTLRRTARAGALCLTAMTTAAAPAAAAPRLGLNHKRLSVTVGDRLTVSGHLFGLTPGQRRPTASLQVRRGHGWATLDRARLSATGRFVLRHRAHVAESRAARVRLSGGQTRRLGQLNVYRYAQASWYGPGLYGGHLGCGGTLTPGRLGVANKSLPCGTPLTLRHDGRSLRVRVIDRGPYVAGREFDLTAATAARLHFHGHGAILVSR
jgi:rare lipoprotein A (peptidoglycan hydrolase)